MPFPRSLFTTDPLRSAASRASFVLAFILGAAAVWATGAAIARKGNPERHWTTIDFLPRLRGWHREMQEDRERRLVAMVGDSMLFPDGLNGSLPERVDALLSKASSQGRQVSLHTLSWPAWSAIGVYACVDEIAAVKPDLVALEVNLHGIEPAPLQQFAYTELFGLIRPRRWLAAAVLPLSDAGFTVNRMLTYYVGIRAKLERSWLALIDRQAHFVNSREALDNWVGEKTHTPTVASIDFMTRFSDGLVGVIPNRNRPTPNWLERALGSSLRGIDQESPRLVVLGALLRDLHHAGIPVLVWVSPVNVDYFSEVGWSDAGLRSTMKSLRAVSERNGARFADFHGLLRDDQFRDLGDHYTSEGPESGMDTLAPSLSSAILSALAGTTKPGAQPGSAHAVQ